MSILATDDFNRANADPISGSWGLPGDSSNFTIASNAAGQHQLSLDSSANYTGVTWPADQYSQCKVTVTGTGGGGAGAGPGVRISATKNYYRLVMDHATSNNVELGKKVSGTHTQLWLRTSSFTDGAVWYLEVQGTTLIAKNGGTAVGASQTDASLSSGAAGLTYSSTVTASSLDDWEGGDFAAAGARANMLTLLGVA